MSDRNETRLPDDLKITVCDECLRACCWQGVFMCEESRYAGIKQLTVAELKALRPTLANGEHWDYWESDTDAQEWLEKHPEGEAKAHGD